MGRMAWVADYWRRDQSGSAATHTWRSRRADCYGDRDRDMDADADRDMDADADAHAYSHWHTDVHANTDANTDADSACHSNQAANCAPTAAPDCDQDSGCNANRDGGSTCACRRACANRCASANGAKQHITPAVAHPDANSSAACNHCADAIGDRRAVSCAEVADCCGHSGGHGGDNGDAKTNRHTERSRNCAARHHARNNTAANDRNGCACANRDAARCKHSRAATNNSGWKLTPPCSTMIWYDTIVLPPAGWKTTMIETPQIAHVLALQTGATPEEFTLAAGQCTIGRSHTCDIVVPGRVVSRLHARIERGDLRFLLVDAGSANGTFVNGVRLTQPQVLANNDMIGLGLAIAALRFLDPDPTFVPATRLDYDERSMRFSLAAHALDLTPIQFRLLAHLYRHAGSLCTREDCAQAIWGRDYNPGLDSAALDRAVANLRAALRATAPAADLIQTRRGVGYVLEL